MMEEEKRREEERAAAGDDASKETDAHRASQGRQQGIRGAQETGERTLEGGKNEAEHQ